MAEYLWETAEEIRSSTGRESENDSKTKINIAGKTKYNEWGELGLYKKI